MARLLDRVKAEELLGSARSECAVANASKETWERALAKRAQAFLAANEGGILVQEIADHCGCSVGLVKLEIGKAKKLRDGGD